MTDEWNLLQATFSGDPRTQKLNHGFSKAVHTNKTTKWREFLEDVNLGKGAGKLWKFIKQLNRQPRAPDNKPVSFNSKPVWDKLRVQNSSTRSSHSNPPPTQTPAAAQSTNFTSSIARKWRSEDLWTSITTLW